MGHPIQATFGPDCLGKHGGFVNAAKVLSTVDAEPRAVVDGNLIGKVSRFFPDALSLASDFIYLINIRYLALISGFRPHLPGYAQADMLWIESGANS